MGSSDSTTKEKIAESRQLCSIGDHGGALHVLPSLSQLDCADEIRAEMVRVYLVQGDRKSASLSMSGRNQTTDHGANPYQDLLSIQAAFIEVSICGNLSGALHTAVSVWQKHGTVAALRDGDENMVSTIAPSIFHAYGKCLTLDKVRIGYYCLEIYDLWRRYGEGHMNPQICIEGDLLKVLISRLTHVSLYFEALEIIEYFIQDPEPCIEAMASSLLADDNMASIECLLRLAKIQAEAGDNDNVETTLSLIDQLATEEVKTAKLYGEQIALRYLNGKQDDSFKILRLIQLSEQLYEQGHYDGAMHTLESAAELHCQLPTTPQLEQLGIQIHDLLRHLCERSDDNLSLMQFEFRRCDMMNPITGDFFEARKRRDELLSSPLSARLPYFERLHKRQSAEYFMLHQREEALRHAEKYLNYCKKYGEDKEQSLAENLRLQCIVQPERMSDDARIELLEDVHLQLKRGIERDKTAERHLAQIEKQLLLVEIVDELGTLQAEDRERIFASVAGILDEAEELCMRINFDSDNIFLRYETGYLRSIFSAEAACSGDSPSMPQGTDLGNKEVIHNDVQSRASARLSFHVTEYMYKLTLAIRNNSLPILQGVHNKVERELRLLESKGNALKRAALLIFRGIFYYILSLYEGTAISDFLHGVDMNSANMAMEVSLACFEEALDLREAFEKEVAKEGDRMATLAAEQSYSTGALELLFEIASEICFILEDNDQTWKWIQRRKARAFSTSLWNGLNRENRSHVLGLPSKLDFEDALWASMASSRKIVFVDWAPFGLSSSRIMLFALQFDQNSGGPTRRVSMAEIARSAEDLREAAWKINPARLDDADAQRYLQPFQPVIQPLEEFSEEGHILILSPTAPFHNVPLHAVEIGGKPLIERNPVVYVPSFSALVSCLQRMEAPKPQAKRSSVWRSTILGAYDDASNDVKTLEERRAIYDSLKELSQRLDAMSLVGTNLTTNSFKAEVAGTNLLHFHGHGQYYEHDIKRQSLELGGRGEILTLNDIATLELDNAHVALITCQGGIQDFSLQGDEPLGLLSVFLLGGATSVLGALWPIQSTTGRKFTRIYYDYFINHLDRTELGPIVNLAMALQHTVLRIRESPETKTPYHWAAFKLYGAWFCHRKPGTW